MIKNNSDNFLIFNFINLMLDNESISNIEGYDEDFKKN